MATPGRPEKTMSSRLLTMKFMQRAAASSPKTPASPDDTPPPKRLKSNNSSPTTALNSDQRAVLDAVKEAELKRLEALERQVTEGGETKWVLNYKDSQTGSTTTCWNVVSAGYNVIDAMPMHDSAASYNGVDVESQLAGRRSFGRFNRKLEREQGQDDISSTDSSDDSLENDLESSGRSAGDGPSTPHSTASDAPDQIRAKRKARKKAKQAEAMQIAEKRRGKVIKLNKLATISSGGGSSKGSSPNIQCYKCGSTGHTKKNCPRSPGHDSRR